MFNTELKERVKLLELENEKLIDRLIRLERKVNKTEGHELDYMTIDTNTYLNDPYEGLREKYRAHKPSYKNDI